ncbi:MAG: acylphosphatase [Thermoguttaceae bacterium]|jgi:acylphosphatase
MADKGGTKSATERREANYSGNVQGVGFRYTVRALAAGFAVTGFVKNLSDGRVEIVVEGEPREVQAFLKAVRAEMRRYIADVQETTSPSTGRFSSFDIRF